MDSWEKINAVQRMQDYIDEHITDPISLYMLAEAARYSPWHSSRIFKELTGKTPFAYIRELRLSRAAIKLRDDNVKIIDVAFDFVFDSHEGFTRAFSKQFGMTPQYYCKIRNINIDFLNMIKYYGINTNEHEQNGVDKEEYILARSRERRWLMKIFVTEAWK